MALSAAAATECCWVRYLLESVNVVLTEPVKMYEDNRSCIHLANNTVTSSKSKHIEIRYHFVRDLITRGVLTVVWCSTKDMIADALTKFSLSTDLLSLQRDRMMSGSYSGPER